MLFVRTLGWDKRVDESDDDNDTSDEFFNDETCFDDDRGSDNEWGADTKEEMDGLNLSDLDGKKDQFALAVESN